jgi:hypothetical protein
VQGGTTASGFAIGDRVEQTVKLDDCLAQLTLREGNLE